MEIKQETTDYLSKLTDTIKNLNLNEIETVFNVMLECYKRDGQIFIFGNGGSASTASHLTADLNKGVSLGLDRRFKIICLNDNIPTMLAYANDLSYNDVFVEQLKNFLKKDDVVIGISGSGNSENVLKAIEYANKVGAITIGVTGYDGGRLKNIAKYSVNANVMDMQISEDIHMIVSHIIMKLFYKKLKDEK
ncbi:MAG: SIS domain-containing protein [bacterium]